MKRVILILLPLILTSLAILTIYRYIKPDVENFVTKKIRAYSSKYLAMEITAEHFSLHFFAPAFELSKIKIAPKDPKALGVSVIEIESASVQFDFLQLLGGKIIISSIQLNAPKADVNLDALMSPTKETNKLNLEPLFRELRVLPIRQIIISDLVTNLESKQYNIHIPIENANTLIVNQGDRLVLETEIKTKEIDYKNIKEKFYITAGAEISRNLVDIRRIHIEGLQSDINISGTLTEIQNIFVMPQGHAHVEFQTNLPLLREKIKQLIKLPSLSGKTNIISDFDFEGKSIPQGSIQVSTDDLMIDDYEIGKVQLKGQWKNNIFNSSHIIVNNKATNLELKDFSIESKLENESETFYLKTKIETEKLNLHELLKLVKAGDVPVELFLSGGFNCEGPIHPQFSLNCKGALQGKNLEVSSGSFKIIQVDALTAQGEVHVDQEKVWYSSDLKIHKDEGKSEGTVTYATGFDIQYSTPSINFKSIADLAGLKLEGAAKMSGRTIGDSRQATFFIDTEGQDVWLENYYLGHPKMMVRYEKGILNFEHINSAIATSHYSGDVKVNLAKSTLQLQGHAANLEVADALQIFQRRVTLPIELTGTANVTVSAEGPFDFSHMSYRLNSQLNRGTIAGEGYDQIDFDVRSKNGEVRTEKVSLKKGSGVLTGQGQAHPDGQIQFNLTGNNFLLEESETISKLSANIAGVLQFNLGISGHILHPEFSISNHLENFTIEDQTFPASTAQIKINNNEIQGKINLFEGKLRSDFLYSLSDKGPFKLQVTSRDWNYTTLLAMVGDSSLLSEYQASLTGDFDFHSETGGIFNVSGLGTIEKVSIARGNLSLSNPVPMIINAKNGKISLNNFRVRGGDNYVELMAQDTSYNHLALKFDGKTQLRIFQIFAPFLDELAGFTSFQMNINGRAEKPEILGNAHLDSGFIKLKNLPPSFEKLVADIQFSQSKIFVTNLTGQFAGGGLKGEGSIQLLGIKNYPVNFRTQFTNISLNLPAKVHTTGSADLVITGSWFPFLLSGTYNITSGFIDKEFSDETIGALSKQSSYLPKSILQSSFEPLHLDIEASISKPVVIRNSMLDATITGNLQIKGSPAQPSLSGRITTEKNAKLAFRDKIFDVINANLNFTDGPEINPELYVSARSRITDYDINLLVQGTAKSPLVHLSSSPPLAEQDIASLIALGILTSPTNKIIIQQKDQQQNATQIGIFAQQLLSVPVQKAFNVDIQISNQYDDTKNLSTQVYTFQKKISDKVIVAGSLTRGDLTSNEVKLKYSLDPNRSLSASYENTEASQTGTATGTGAPTNNAQEQILGIDLEFKKEFKW